MPDARLKRTRATLPEGYQYGDAKRDGVRLFLSPVVMGRLRRCGFGRFGERGVQPEAQDVLVGDAALARDGDGNSLSVRAPLVDVVSGHSASLHPWRAPHENAAAQLKRRATAFDDMTAHSAAEMLDLLESQRTGDAPLMWTCGDEGRPHWFEGPAGNHTPNDRCICGARTCAEEYAQCRRPTHLSCPDLEERTGAEPV